MKKERTLDNHLFLSYHFYLIKKIIFPTLLPLLCLLILFSLLCKKRPGDENYLIPINVSGEDANVSYTYPLSLAIDSGGTLHLVWTDDTTGGLENILYAIKPQGGVWSKPVRVAYDGRFPFIAIGKDDVVHFTWQQFATLDTINHISGWVIGYRYKETDGDWSTPETLFTDLFSGCPSLTVDNAGNVHLVWISGRDEVINYAMRSREGIWTPPTVLLRGWDSFIFADRNDFIHLFSSDYTDSARLIYMFRSPEGNWSNPETIFKDSPIAQICDISTFIDEEGDIHAYWLVTVRGWLIYYSERDASDGWSKPLSLPFSANTFLSFLNSAKETHLVLEKGDVFLHSKKVNEGWTVPDTIRVKDLSNYGGMKGVIDADDTLHLVWIQNMGFEKPKEVYYVSFKP